MENGQKKLKELFDGRKIFKIPDYQRTYAWEEKPHLSDFIEDIENQISGHDYFLGTVLFQENGNQPAGVDLIDIVDGQQRITTIIIFMKVLLTELRSQMTHEDFEKDALDLVQVSYTGKKKHPKLRTISLDDDFFQSYIMGDGCGKDYIKTPSQRRLYDAKKYFQECLKKRSKDDLLKLKSKLDEGSKFLTYFVTDASEAALIFETTNDRGKRLTNLEKIKSFLMYKASLATEGDGGTSLRSIQQRFAEIYRDMEQYEGQLEEDTVLQYHCIAFEKWTNKADYQHPVNFIREKINSLIKEGKKTEALEFIEIFSKGLKESYSLMGDLLKCKDSEYRDLACLGRFASFYPLLLKTLKLDSTREKTHFRAVCQLLEIYTFRVFAIGKARADAGQAKIYKFSQGFSGEFKPLCDDLKTLIMEKSPERGFITNLKSDLYDRVKSSDLRYLIWKYENYLRQTEKPICPNMSEEEFLDSGKYTQLTVDHIAPQNPKVSKRIIWNEDILSDIDFETGSDFIEEHIHKIGNLTFYPALANSSNGNIGIAAKNESYRKVPYKTQKELESFFDNGKWNVTSIEKRGEKIVEFCLKKWNPKDVNIDML